MYGSKRVAVRDLNPHILCALCGGYLIQATTVIECLHSFCRSCIVNFLETSKVCPICDAQIHKTRPLLNIRPDQTLQSLVYKLVPGLFQDEMRRRREFHATLPESDLEDLSLEERGEACLEKEFKPGDDHVSLALQLVFREDKSKPFEVRDRRYLLCPSEVTVHHLKKFVRMKFHLSDNYKIEMYRAREELSDDLMLQDIALIYSWRGDRPMNICYTVAEPPKAKSSGKCFRRTELVSKQSDVCHIQTASPTGKTPRAKGRFKHLTVCSSEDDVSPAAKSTPDIVLTPVSDITVSKSTSSSPVSETMTPLSVLVPETRLSPSSLSKTLCNDAIGDTLPSVCNNVDTMLPNNQKPCFVATASVANNGLLSPEVDSVGCKQPSADSTSAVALSASTTCQSKSGVAQLEVSKLMHSNTCQSKSGVAQLEVSKLMHSNTCQSKSGVAQLEVSKLMHSNTCQSKSGVAQLEVSKLMHSVESILSKTTKRAPHHKKKSKSLAWTPVSEMSAAPGNVCRDTNGQTGHKNGKHKLEENVRELPDCPVHDSQTSDHVDHLISGFKRSQSVIETFSSGASMPGQKEKSQEVANCPDNEDHTEDTTDNFLSYIPKFQKHRKLCAVKRSISCEGPSVMPVLGISTCDAMEKRNWKKRKLSTLDFDASRVAAVDSCSTTAYNGISPTDRHSLTHHKCEETLSSDMVKKTGSQQLIVDVLTACEKNKQQSASPGSLTPSSAAHFVRSPGQSALLPQGNSSVTSQEQSQPKNNVLDPKVRSCSQKSHMTSATPISATKSNRTSCDIRNSETSTHSSKVSKGKRQARIVDSDSDSSQTYINKKSLGYIMKNSNRSASSHSVALAHGSSSAKSVEEICVEISTSPVEVTNVTSPTAYVTSPGTEDRTDNSTLPEIQTSCVVSFPAKIVPLDLSSKKKK